MNKSNYYSKYKLWLPQFCFWRVWKFQLEDGKVIQLHNQIRSKSMFRKYLLKFMPIAVWYSATCWRNPLKVKGKLTPKNDAGFISNDLIFDIDEKNLNLAKKRAKELIKEMRTKFKKEPEYILMSGGKGFHISYGKTDLKEKEEILNKIETDVDLQTTKDLYGVYRVNLTIHKSGNMARFIKEEELDNLEDNPESYDATGRAMKKFLSLSTNGRKAGTGLTALPYASKFITNRIEGTKRYIVALFYHFPFPLSFSMIRNEIEKIARQYNIGSFYMIRYEDGVLAVSLKAFDLRRAEKIYRNSTASNKSAFEKFHQIFIRTAEKVIKKELNQSERKKGIIRKEEITKPKAMFVFFSPYGKSCDYFSNPHRNFLEYLKFKILDSGNWIGTKNKIYTTYFEPSWRKIGI